MNTLSNDFLFKQSSLLKRIAKTPDNIDAMIELAQLYLKESMLDQAKSLLQTIEAHHPDSEIIQNNLGTILYRQNYYDEAVKYFIRALKIKLDYFDAMYNLALVYKAQNKEEDALASLLAIIETDPKHVRAHLLAGKILLEKKEYGKADYYFQLVIQHNLNEPNLFENIIQLLLSYERYQDAKSYCEKALKFQPKSVEINYLLGVIYNRLSEKTKALNCYHAALQIEPNYFPALNNLAVIYLEQQNIAAAKFYFSQALKQHPDNQSIQHTLNALAGGKNIGGLQKEYIQTLFDSYADHYEQHLTISLDYVVPETLKKMIQCYLKDEMPHWRILDLGCGTGLCGELFKVWASELIGVDISPKMIEIARKKCCFDELIESENQEYLSHQKNRFDLILAADVFIYQGDLTEIFSACFNALNQGGLLAFTTEIDTGGAFSLQETSRFSHAHKYISSLAEEIGLHILTAEIHHTRLQREQQLTGEYWLLLK